MKHKQVLVKHIKTIPKNYYHLKARLHYNVPNH